VRRNRRQAISTFYDVRPHACLNPLPAPDLNEPYASRAKPRSKGRGFYLCVLKRCALYLNEHAGNAPPISSAMRSHGMRHP